MNLNLTLIGQSITFFVFVWFCMKFVWPPIMKALHERRKNIADGLAAAERGKHELELAEKRAVTVLQKAKDRSSEIISHAEKRASEIADEAKVKARGEAERIVTAARGDVEQEIIRAREELRASVAELVVTGAGKILEKEIDAKAHAKLVDDVVAQL